MKHKWILGLAASSLLAALPVSQKVNEVKAEDGYLPVEGNWQFHHIRKHHSGDLDIYYPGTWYNFSDFNDFNNGDTSLFRIPLVAETSGSYTITFKYNGGSYHTKVFVNNQEGQEILLRC